MADSSRWDEPRASRGRRVGAPRDLTRWTIRRVQSGPVGRPHGHSGRPTCGRRDFTQTNFTIDAEFLVSQTFPLSIFGGYTFTDFKASENANNPLLLEGMDDNANTFFIGVRYYMGGMGSLVDMHRNGNVRPWLRGTN